jgi:Ca2+-transporting ATPase
VPLKTEAGAPSWHARSIEEVNASLRTRHTGLTSREVQARLATHGLNQLPEPPPTSRLAVLLHQIKSPLIYILGIATIVTVTIGEYVDASVIAAVVALNTLIGYVQERKAEGSVRALMKLISPRARVMREGREREVDSRELVPGDVVLLESGTRVPADLRLFSTTALSVDESLLTGESAPVRKDPSPVGTDALLADRPCMAYTGTVVASGRGRGYVVATGLETELGAIAEEVRGERRSATPLQARMGRFARVIGLAVAAAAIFAFALGLALGRGASDMFLLSVALAVSAVPEGLPVILTITLAIGVQRMAGRNAILSRLPAVETLGSTTVIGSDKTGTLTENRMTVEQVWSDGRTTTLPPGPRDTGGQALAEHHPLYLTLLTGVLANEAEVYDTPNGLETRGDPTEVALLVAASRFGIEHEESRARYRTFAEIPFEPEQQYSASIRIRDSGYLTFVKGAPERVLGMSQSMLTDEGKKELEREAVLAAAREMAAKGLRVLAMAYRETHEPRHVPDEVREPEALCFLGLVGMMDPPRAGVREAIRGCQAAGIRVVMITGDHAETARAIGEQLGIAERNTPVLAGRELLSMMDEELRRRVRDVAVFARVAPEGKLRIVRALQSQGEVVAVTGDGVNDAPALKAADIGVAMGKSGTDVAREAADMVLADDNFVSIYAAVEEGRVVFENVRKVTFFLISANAAEMTAILFTLALGWAIPFLPTQLLWLNLVTDGLLVVALAFEPGEKGVLEQPPRKKTEGIISPLLWERTGLAGLVMAAGTLFLFHWVFSRSGSLGHAQTVALTTMVLFQVFHVGNCRSERFSLFRKSPFSNRFLFLSAGASLAVHVAALYLRPTQFLLRVEPLLDWQIWAQMIAVAASILVAMELHKLLRKQRVSPRPRE